MINKTAFGKYIEDNIRLVLYLKDGISEECSVLPPHLYIEPTNACNLKCPYCYGNRARVPQFMDFAVFSHIIEDLAEHDYYPRVTLVGNGEPLLHKNIVNMVKVAKGAGLHVSLLCNATICDEAKAEQLLEAKLDRIQFSIDAIDKETYDRMRVPRKENYSYFEETIKNALTYIKLNYEHGRPSYISISSLQCNLNKDKLGEFTKFWGSLPIDNVFPQPLLTLQANSEFTEAIAQQYQGEMRDKQICVDPWISLFIHSDGNAHACSFDEKNNYPLANVKEQSIVDIWNNDRIRRLRNALIMGEVDYFSSIGHDCRKCNAPLTGTGLKDYINNAPRSIARMSSSFLGQHHEDEAKYQNLLCELERRQK